METLAQEWIEEGKLIGIDIGEKRGIDIGKKEGIEQGKLAAQRQTLLYLLTKRFPEASEQPEKFAQAFEQISDYAALVRLLDHLLLVPTLAAFTATLQTFLPQTEATTA